MGLNNGSADGDSTVKLWDLTEEMLGLAWKGNHQTRQHEVSCRGLEAEADHFLG